MTNLLKNNESIKTKHIAALASGLGLVLATSAEAAIVYTDVTPDWVASVSESHDTDSYHVDFNADSVIDVTISVDFYGDTGYQVVFGEVSPERGGRLVGSQFDIDNLNSGSTIGENSSFTSRTWLGSNHSYYGVGGNVVNAGRSIIGVKFVIDGDTKYGWIGLEFSAPTSENGTMTIFDFAYENSGASIKAGDKGAQTAPSVAVPEPSSMALLATGALAIAGFRRRKRQQRTS